MKPRRRRELSAFFRRPAREQHHAVLDAPRDGPRARRVHHVPGPQGRHPLPGQADVGPGPNQVDARPAVQRPGAAARSGWPSRARASTSSEARLRHRRPGVLRRHARRQAPAQRRYLFAEIFAIMAFAEYGRRRATRALERAKVGSSLRAGTSPPRRLARRLEPKVNPGPGPCAATPCP